MITNQTYPQLCCILNTHISRVTYQVVTNILTGYAVLKHGLIANFFRVILGFIAEGF